MNKEFAILITIILLALVLRLWKVGEIPLVPTEARVGIFNFDVIHSGQIPLNTEAPYQGPLFSYITLAPIYFFGNDKIAYRIPSIIFSILTIFFTYLITKKLYNKKVAIISVLILTILPGEIFAANRAKEFTLLTFFVTLGLLIVVKFYNSGNKKLLYYFALVSAIGSLARLTYLFFSAAVFFGLLWLSHKNKRKFLDLKTIFISLFIFTIGISPFIFYNLFNNFATFNYINENVFSSFPVTSEGANLLDIITNLNYGLKEFFSALGGSFYPVSIGNNIGLLFSFIFIFFLVFTKYADSSYKNKNYFITIIFVLHFIFVSTITINTFKRADFVSLMPLTSIIMGWSIFQIIIKLKNKVILLLFISFIASIFVFQLNLLFTNQNLYKVQQCENSASKLMVLLKDITYSSVIVDSEFNSAFLKWFDMMSESRTNFEALFFVEGLNQDIINSYINDRRNIYVFFSNDCNQIIEWRQLDMFGIFLNITKSRNLDISEINSLSLNGKEMFKIYRIN